MNTASSGAGRVVFAEAVARDDADIRRMLREHPMPGAVSLSLEREPSLEVGQALEGGEHRTLVCRAGTDGELLAVGGQVTRLMLVGGVAQRVAYLTQLRVTARGAGRRGVIFDGYARMRELLDTPPPLVYTSILEENLAARRLLERGLPGMPGYRFLSPFHTFVLGRGVAVRGGVERVSRLDVSDAVMVAALLGRTNAAFALAPRWSEEEVKRVIGTGTLALWGVRDERTGLKGCAGVWDLSAGKQAVVRGYSGALRWGRGVVNLASGAMGTPHLPRVGEALRTRFLSHLSLEGCGAEEALALLAVACGHARKEGASVVAGVAPDHASHALLARHAWSTLRSRIYCVCWRDGPHSRPALSEENGGHRIHLEVAQL